MSEERITVTEGRAAGRTLDLLVATQEALAAEKTLSKCLADELLWISSRIEANMPDPYDDFDVVNVLFCGGHLAQIRAAIAKGIPGPKT